MYLHTVRVELSLMHETILRVEMAAVALWELPELILINRFKLTGLQKNRDAAANFGCSWKFNPVNGNYGD